MEDLTKFQVLNFPERIRVYDVPFNVDPRPLVRLKISVQYCKAEDMHPYLSSIALSNMEKQRASIIILVSLLSLFFHSTYILNHTPHNFVQDVDCESPNSRLTFH